MKDKIKELFNESIETKLRCIENGFDSLYKMAEIITNSIQKGNKLILCGNGGSAADSQHLAAELLIRLRSNINRKSIPAIALTQDVSTITACGNDLGFEFLYQRLIESLGTEGDCLIAISTSGNSKNILLAMEAARNKAINTFSFLGSGGGDALSLSDLNFLVPSSNTGRIQESHIAAGHALMELIEDKLLDAGYI